MRGEASSSVRGNAVAALLVASACFGLPQPAHAQAVHAQPGPWGLETLMRELSQVKLARAQFVERKYLRVLSQPLELSGTLVYEAPGRLEKHTLKPKPERLVVADERLTIERGGRRARSVALQEYPVLWAFVESFRATLSGDLAALERFYEVALSGDAGAWQLVLVPRQSRMQQVIRSIRIGGSDGRVRSVEVEEAQGDRSVMTVIEDPA